MVAKGAYMASLERTITVRVADAAVIQALVLAASQVLIEAGERGELKSYDRCLADLWTALDALNPVQEATHADIGATQG
jgi:hypothetical protein